MLLTEILEKIQGAHIAVVGDAMVDHYEFGRVDRICPEAPVPVFISERSENRPGGAANVLRQLSALGCEVYQAFAPDWCIKTRYMAGQQLVLRVDNDRIAHPDAKDVEGVSKYLRAILRIDALVLSDYDKGWLSYEMCQAVIKEMAERGGAPPVVVDPKGGNWDKYRGCGLICPNNSELKQFTTDVPDEVRWPGWLLWKRGPLGMRLVEPGAGESPFTDIPTTARRVYDVTGAGDCIVAVVAAALAVGASKFEAATLAALAAGWCVGEVGTVSCSRETLKELIDEEELINGAD
jgi:rfaE bifunctional protein kinase chain/domain